MQASATPQHDYTYLWFDGSKAPFIAVDQPGNYCVTITRPADSCVSVVCTDVVLNNRLYASVSASSQPQENMLVVLNEVVNYQLVPRDTLVSDVAGNVVFEQVVPGFYALQAIPPAGHPLADDFFPTYYIAGTLWQEAYQFPFGGLAAGDQQPSSFDIALLPTQQFGGGPGVISGLVTQAPGFTVFPGSDGAGAASGQGPLSNVEMLLFSTSGMVSMYTYTNTNGQFSFSNLPYGTYYVYINLHGTPIIYAIIELSPGNTVVNGLLFTVTSSGASVGTGESMLSKVRIYPNPVQDVLHLVHDEAIEWTVYDALGKNIQHGSAPSGPRTPIDAAPWPAGMYLLKLQGNRAETLHLWFVKQD